MDVLARLGVLVLLALLVVGGSLLLRARNVRSLRRAQREALFSGLVVPGRPAVVAFSAPGCVVCRAQQNPALDQLAADLDGAAEIVRLSAPEHPTLVAQLGILSVPVTVVLNQQGQVQQLNHGFADAQRLHAQLHPLLSARPSA